MASSGALLFGVPGVLATAVFSPLVQGASLAAGFRRPPSVAVGLVAHPLSAKIGVPIELMWLAQMNVVGVDKVVVLFGLNVKSLGYYTIAGLGGVLVSIGPTPCLRRSRRGCLSGSDATATDGTRFA